jgi:hypothetical protein
MYIRDTRDCIRDATDGGLSNSAIFIAIKQSVPISISVNFYSAVTLSGSNYSS